MKNNFGKRGLGEQNHMFFYKKSLNNGVVNGGIGPGSSTEDDTRFNKATEDGNNRLRGLIQIHGSLHTSQQPPQGPNICWERFLPVRSIKVLLVEDDDSTRRVVRALLRNCSYEGINVVFVVIHDLALECICINLCISIANMIEIQNIHISHECVGSIPTMDSAVHPFLISYPLSSSSSL